MSAAAQMFAAVGRPAPRPPPAAEATRDLAALNRDLEASGELPPAVWAEWLWGSEPEEGFAPEVLLNRNQLLGLLVCRYKHRHAAPSGGPARPQDRLSLMEKEPAAMSWSELKDTLANVQIEWPAFLQRLERNRQVDANLMGVKALVDGCAERFGALCSRAWPSEVLNDPMDTESPPGQGGGPLRVLTPGALRRGVGTLLILYRHLHLLAASRPPRAEEAQVPEVRLHHYEASMSDYYLWYMHFQLPLAAKLNYKHDFPGMYNHVTQPVYFHNPGFERLARLPMADRAAPAIHVLPSLCQLFPELPVRFEEDAFDPTRDAGWYWVIVSGRVYLVGSGPRVFYSTDARAMLREYVLATKQ
jgi:hypothetical protein